MRLIPKNTKVKTQFYRGITLTDVILGVLVLAVCALIVTSNLKHNLIIALGIVCLSTPMFLPLGDEKLYMSAYYVLSHTFSRKRYLAGGLGSEDISGLIPYGKIEDGYIVNKDGSFAGAIEIKPIEFRLLGESKQNFLIDGIITNVLSNLSIGQEASILKLDKPLALDRQIDVEAERIRSLISNYESGISSENEYKARMDILEDRLAELDQLNTAGEVKYSGYYIIVFDRNLKGLQSTLSYMRQFLLSGALEARILDKPALLKLLKLNMGGKLFEKLPDDTNSIAAVTPDKLEFRLINTIQDDRALSHFVITQYPLQVFNGWGDELFDLPDTKVIMKLHPVDKAKAIRRIDTAINELSAQGSGKASKIIGQNTHIETLSSLLYKLQNDNEALFDVTLIATAIDGVGNNVVKKSVRRKLRELGFSYTEMAGRQQDAYLSAGISTYDNIKISRGIQASSVAASFPFVSNAVVDERGLLIGENKLPVVIDFFKRNDEYVNSNMVIVGKPGSGKSYAAKTLIANLATLDSKILILDPEGEYTKLVENLKGKALDASSAKHGKINPFHIIASLEDENEDGGANSFYAHLQFLEEFMKLILQGINADCLEMVNKSILEVYRSKGINTASELNLLKAEDYPTFEDLALHIDGKLESESDSYTLLCLKIIQNYLSKFRSGGRNSALWNGPSSFDAKENLVCFNFQKLLANKNNLLANAQMLLLLKWVENEVIKNRDYNLKNGTDRKVIVVIDEAHIFIDDKYPIALDFMFNLAKRIRKYSGMQIIITQNIKDFAGTPETVRKSMAIINVSQYSLIFSLSPNDMADLCKLYEKAGEINESEQNSIVYNPRGCAFLISSPTSRTNIKIMASPYVEELFTEGN